MNATVSPPGVRRVLYFDHTSLMSGGEIALLNLVKTLDRSKFYPIVVLATGGPLVAKLREAGVETHICPLSDSVRLAKKDTLGLSTILKLGDVVQTFRYTWKLVQMIRKFDVDIVHTNSLKADVLGGVAGRLSSTPVVWHVRDRIAPDYLPSHVVRIFRFTSRWLPSWIIANSNATLQTVALRGFVRGVVIYSGMDVASRRMVVHDGMNQPDSPYCTRDPENAGPIIGLVGRISPWKGQHIFLEAAAKVVRSYPNARFQIVGAALFDEQEYERYIHDLCARLNLTNSVEFLGFQEDVPAVMRNMSLVVHASTIGEPFGQVVLEAMSLAKPVVATAGGGVTEIVVDGHTGMLVPMGDADAMAEAIMKVLADPEFASRLGLNGYDRANAIFTIEQTARNVERVYSSIPPKRRRHVHSSRG